MTDMTSSLGAIRCELGENPLWHSTENCLYWTDIPAGSIYRYVPNSDACTKVYQGDVVGGFTIQADDTLLLFMGGGRVAKLSQGEIRILVDGIPEERTTRFNDVIADPRGRVFCGTMPTDERPGRLYRLDPDGTLNKLLEGVRCSNGLAFSPDHRFLYYTDSHAYTIYRFHYSENTGDISNQDVFIRCSEADGFPDGLTCDSDGYLWSARWGGGCIIRYSPEGFEERRIGLPAKLVTSLTFGSEGFSEIYVTTAKDPGAANPDLASGALFRLSTGIHGVQEFRSQISDLRSCR